MAEPLRRPASYAQGRLHSIAVHALLIAAYVASGRLGLFLAVPPGYATAIFPPAGVAATAAVMYGIEVVPSVFVASFALNLWTGAALGGSGVGRVAAAALVIAAASALQAGIAGTVLRRAIGYPMALDTGRDLRRFLALPPLCCLVSATLSLTGLWALGTVAPAALLANWVTWWVGDTLGVLVVLPLLMVLAGEPRGLWRSRARPVALPMLLFFGFFVAVFIRVSTWESDQALLEFQLLSQQAADRVKTRLEEQEIFLAQLQGSFEHATAMPRATFTTLVEGILARFPMIRGVGWAPRVEGDQRAEFEAAQRAEISDFTIRRLGPNDTFVPAPPAQVYYPVLYVAPRIGNARGTGFDVLSDPQRGPAVAKALAANTLITTVPLPVGAISGQPTGMLVILPVPSGGAGPGLVLVKLQIGSFITSMLEPMNAKLTLRLVDTATSEALFDDFPARTAAHYRQDFVFGQRRYEIETAPSALYVKEHRGWQSWALLVVGVLGTGLLGALLMLGTGYTNRIERQIDERTGDLAAANRLLRIEIDERRNAEAALRHAQRMEAIGQLTGGIAHDFNNLLTVMSANAELIHNAGSDEAVLRRSGSILRAAERGERLTRQLLAFSRRQNLRPEIVDLRLRTAEMAEMLARSTRDDIHVSVEMPDDLWPVSVDRAEFELAVLNLAVNARDAMPGGGDVSITARNMTIAAADAPADGMVGDFVSLTLNDTGTGMSPETLARAFEPYFTTKEVGAGSGLGLSQVYGFASQSGGTATIDSTPGAGTTVTLYLPRATGRPATTAALPMAGPRDTALHKILVVEDEAEIAELTGSILRELGHDTVHARDGTAALAMVRDDPAIGLVISDIVMPGATNGLELARALRVERPALPVLLVTGYSQYGPEVAGEAFELLEKPYRRETLVNAVRAALDGRSRGSGGMAAG